MKVEVILKGKKIKVFKETAEILVNKGIAKYPGKADHEAGQRQTKIIEPEKKKRWNDLSPELESIANNPPPKKRGRPRKK